ncbi:MAG TPA: T9SS type A sorting domain-containing protein [Ignavibacteria bacterium]|nr:T9SS type A sorting domain-containing protein [Ignavibacteria bacterium]
MKKIISFFTVALLLLFTVSTFAQVTIPAANTNTNGDRHPLSGYFGYERTALIYKQSEIGQYGTISKIAFYLNSNASASANIPVVVKMNTTALTALATSQTYATTSTGAVTVFSGTISGAQYVAGTWIEITLDSPFNYSADNLLVLVETNYGGSGSGEGSTTKQFRRSAPVPASNCMTVWNADNSPPTGTASPTSTRSNVQLTFGAAPANDVGVSAVTIGTSNLQIISVGKGYNVTATVKNFGTTTQNVVPVYYKVNGGSAIGPVNTVGPIVQGATENVVFNGGNAFIPATPGLYNIKIYTSLAGDASATNDTLTVNLNVLAKISSFPYIETFNLATGWTVFGNAVWSLSTCVNPDGVAADPAAIANFYSIANGAYLTLRSPEMDFTGISNPVLDFYVAYKTYTGGESDTLRVMVSTDGGVTFSPAATTYNKSWDSNPSLATLPPASGGFVPTAASQWRHETVDLSNVGNSANVVIGFVGVSNFGNNAWVDNVIVSQPNSLCTDNVSGPGTYNCNSIVSLDFTATPLPPPSGNQSSVNVKKNEKADIESTNNFDSYYGNAVFNQFSQTDNPNGGTAFVSQYTNNDPGQNIATNTTATAPDLTISTPTNVYHDFWFTITYDGNDYQGYATYNINIDISGAGFTIPSALYIVKRADVTGAWVCQNTTLSGNILTVTGLTDFSDFALAGQEALPVELASFVSTINGRNVELNWATASETNNSGFDIERSSANGSWTKIANVSGNGTSTIAHSYSYTDRNLASGTYSYRLKQIDFNGNFEYFSLNNEVNIGVPTNFDLSQNYPNPFNPSTKINYALPVDGKVSIKIFDMSGKEVMTLVNETKTAGYYSVSFNGSNLSSGIYFYSINAGSFVSTKKMTLIK